MKIDGKTIDYLSELAKIELGPEEKEAQRRDLERVATFAECLTVLDTKDMPAQSHPFGIGESMDRLREDEATNEDMAAEWMKAAPDSKGRFFRVPRTIEE